MKDCQVAVIGLGKMGLLHASILSAIPGVHLVAVCDKKKLIVKLTKQLLEPKTNVVDDLSKLSRFDLDAVFVTTPIPSHFGVIKSVYGYGISKNVFVEKTLAVSPQEAEELCQISAKNHGVNMVGYQKRHCVTFQKAHDLLNQNAIGEPLRFEAYSFSSDFAGLSKDELTEVSISRGGVLRDLGAHALNMALWYFGNLKLNGKAGYTGNDVENGAFGFAVENEKGVTGKIETYWNKYGYRMPETGVIVEGSEGRLHVNDDKVTIEKHGKIQTWYRQDLNDQVAFLLWAPEYYREDYSFIKCIATGEVPNPDFFDALKVEQIIGSALSLC